MNFSIIIPTMWKSDLILEMLPIYEKTRRIKEVIIIDNDTSKTPNLKPFKKVIYLPQTQNIFVNPAWNLGAAFAKHSIILANDDILINDIDELLTIYEKSGYDIIGLNLGETKKGLTSLEQFPAKCFGGCMYVKNYQYIPEQLKIFGGDDFLFSINHKRAMVGGFIETPRSVTVNSENFRQLAKFDTILYMNLNHSKDLNIIIRTSGRPNYFKNCIESIRKFAPNAYLHITIDNFKDLDYVKENCKDFSFNYYLIDCELMKILAKKKPIERNFFPFNEYINIPLSFIRSGWVIILDDDDHLVDKPFYEDETKIYFYRTEICGKKIPSDENFGKNIVFRDFSTCCLVFHSSITARWTPQRGGDYQFALDSTKTHTPIWIDRIISKPQTRGNLGQRNDL